LGVKKKARDILIETASQLFRLRGYEGVGLNDIIEASKIPKGSLYHYFPKGKEELAIEAIQHTKDMVLTEIRNLFQSNEDPVEVFSTHINLLSEIVEDPDKMIGYPIGTVAAEKHSSSEPIRLVCEAAFEEWQDEYRKKLLETGYGVEQSRELGVTITALIEGGILLSLTKKSGNPLRTIAKQIPTLLVNKK
jgi:TetR/AcrR family transcriptional repressor of lmrAB and yxaGH operons